MKYFNYLSLLVISFSTIVNAHENYLGHAPDRGVLISVTPNKISAKSGDKVIFQGTVSAANRFEDDHEERSKKLNLLEEFKKQGLDLIATFPSSAIDVSSQIKFTSTGRDSIAFTYETSAISAVDLNQFSLKLYNNHQEKEMLKKLSKIQAKLERRILSLQNLYSDHQKKKSSKENLEFLQNSIDVLKNITLKITEKLNSNEDLIAENTYALQVDNLTSSSSKISTMMNKFRFVIESQVGTVFKGLGTKIKATVSNLRSKDDDKSDDHYERSDKRIIEYSFNNKIVQTQNLSSLSAGQNSVFEYSAESLSSSVNNLFSVSLYKSEKNKKSSRMGSLYQKIPVVDDMTRPIWEMALSTPNISQQYVKSMQAVDLFVNDSFGRINPASISAMITGTTLAKVAYSQDLTRSLSKLIQGDGWGYAFKNQSPNLEEGDYTLKASVKDFAGNLASPEPYNVNFKIDKTAPLVGIGVEDMKLTNATSIDFPVIVKDLSPAWTELYSNDVLIYTTRATEFTASLPLNIEGQNTIKLISTDEAGNASAPTIVHIVRDTTPPVLSFVIPKAGEAVDGFYFKVSATSNERIIAANLNGQKIEITAPILDLSTYYSTLGEGDTALNLTATDKAGNIGHVTMTVYAISRPLNQSLIGLYIDEKQNKVYVKGAVGATRPNYVVTVSSGFFNSKDVQAGSDGSFLAEMKPSAQYKVSVFDERKSETVSFKYDLDADNDVMLSGVVRDTDNFPLVNAKITIAGTELSTLTDSNGVFNFLKSKFPGKIITGDQQIVVDGTQVVISPEATPRKFSVTSVAITIGVRQSNILQTPIYIAPTYLDGSATIITQQSGGVVSDTHAPGVSLNIPSSAVQYPDASSQSLISMQTIPSEYSTVLPPKEAQPKTVVALEPSGTTFSKSVELVLPNSNQFPPKTEMVIMLMNSKTGKWEIGGAAKVTDDGQSVQTKPNMGIRHFSLAYATIAGPVIRQVGAQDKPGADTFNGSASTKIELPSFKAVGQNVAPSLYYSSSWAKPNVVVTNLIDFPDKQIDVTLEDYTYAGVQSYKATVGYCDYDYLTGVEKCYPSEVDVYRNSNYIEKYKNVKATIIPEKITSYLKTGSIETAPYEFTGEIPRMANVSYAVDLKDPTTKEYFKSGIYPYSAHYDIKFKELLVGTKESTYWDDTMSAVKQVSDLNTFSGSQISTQDLSENIFVNNFKDSEAGTGWKIGGVQKIVNPTNNRIMIQEEDGSVSTYAIQNTINTVLDVGAQSGSLANGVSLNSWPQISVASSNKNEILGFNIQPNGIQKTIVGTNYPVSGKLKAYDYYNYNVSIRNSYQECTYHYFGICQGWSTSYYYTQEPHSYCSNEAYNFEYTSSPVQMLNLGNTIVGVDSNRHSVFKFTNGSASRILGAMTVGKTYSNNNVTNSVIHKNNVTNDCKNNAGEICTSLGENVTTFSGYNKCGIGPQTTDLVPYAGKEIIDGKQGLNKPMGIAASPIVDVVAIADYGNHVVRWLNISTGDSGIIAGNGNASDLGDGGSALNASLSHPQGVVYDEIGNLYISTQSGYVRKVDTNGNISTIAGNPVSGVYANQSRADLVKFNNPYGIAVDNAKNLLYVADSGNNRIVQIDLNSNSAVTIAGTGQKSYSGDGSAASLATLDTPTQLGIDSQGNLLVADSGNNRIRMIVFQAIQSGSLSYISTKDDGSSLIKQSDNVWVRKYRNGNKMYFDSNGFQYASRDRQGLETQYFYDSQNRLTDINLPLGQTIVYTYSGNRLSSIQDPSGRSTLFSYNFSGQLSTVKFPDNSTKSFSYDSDGRLLSETNQNGSQVKYVYNAQGRVEKIISPDRSEVKISDASSKNLNSSNTQLVSNGLEAGQTSDSIVDPNGNSVEIAKDFEGYISDILDAKGRKTSIYRDVKGRPVKTVSADGSIATNTYDQVTGDLLSSTDVSTGITQSKTYDQWGHVTSSTDGKGNTAYKIFDSISGFLLREKAANGQEINYSYTSKGLLKTKSVAIGSKIYSWNYEYDIYGNLSKEIQPDGKYAEYIVDAAGNVTQKRVTSDGSSLIITRYAYDLMNRLTSVTSAKDEVTSYQYSPLGELLKITDPKGKETQFTYDSKSQLVQKIDSFGSISKFNYDLNGNLASEIDPSGQVKSYSYDELNQLIKAQFPDDLVNYEYDIRGKIVKASNMVSQVDYAMDTKSRVTGLMTSGLGTMSTYPQVAMALSYDSNDNRTSLQTNLGSLSYSYDIMNRMTGLQNSWGDSYGFSYDNLNRLVKLQRPGSQTDYSYLDSGVIAGISHSSSGVVKSAFQYGYDQRNMPIQKRTLAGDLNYSYDGNGQLTGVSGIQSETFVYDSIGNRTTDQDGNYIYDQSSQRLIEDYLYMYNYDLNGNLIQKFPKDQSKEAFTYSYSSKNQLMSVSVLENPLGQVKRKVSYVYDVLGRRIQKSVWNKDAVSDPKKTYIRKYVYDGDNVLFEYDGSNNLIARYTQSPLKADDVLAVEVESAGVTAGLAQASGRYQYLKDALGSVSDITDASGNIIQHYEYSSFGKIIAIKDGAGSSIALNPLVSTSYTYTGREWDEEAELYYYRARNYDPSVGRFLQRDPDPGKIKNPLSVVNSYIYVQNKPTMMVDPNGKFPWLVIAIISLATTLCEKNLNSGNFLQKFVRNFAFNAVIYVIGTWLGGAEFSEAATWQQSASTAGNSLAISSGVNVVAWEAQNRGIASDGTIYALAFITGSAINYEYGGDLSWSSVGKAVGTTLTYKSPVAEPSSQVPDSGGTTNEKK